MNDNFCFIITAYDQVNLVEANIARIREQYPTSIKNAPIILVSTSEDDLFSHLSNQEYLHFLHYKDAPGNSLNVHFKTKTNPAGKYIDWRQEYLPPRILSSISKALDCAFDLGCSSALHLHSDTFWLPNKIDNLLNELEEIKEKLFIGDLSFPNEYSSFKNKVLPHFIHFQPEALHFNVKKAKETGFSNFHEIWKENTDFKMHNYGSIEALIGQYANFCLTKEIIVNYKDRLSKKYFKAIGFRTIRGYHGQFRYGLTNLDGDKIPQKSTKEKFVFPILEKVVKAIIKNKEKI